MLQRKVFSLPEEFVSSYSNKNVPWGPLGYFVYKRTYARKVLGTDRTEEWFETVRRVVEGTYALQRSHCATMNLHWDNDKAIKSAQIMYDKIFNMKFLPPGRGLWAMGTEMIWEKGSAALNNCAFISTDNIEQDPTAPFTFLMDMSMLGVGVGSDTLGKNKLTVLDPQIDETPFVVPDTREGWVSLIRMVIGAYFGRNALNSVIDYSEVRPFGAEIVGFGGVASGPEPLATLVDNIKTVLSSRIGSLLTGSDIVDIHNYIGKCVVAGNVRRTAEIMFGEPDDIEFLDLKTDMDALNDRRWASNNSVFAYVGMPYDDIIERVALNGEPGFIYLENAKRFGRLIDGPKESDTRVKGTNPCGEQFLESFELCNLVETFPAAHDSLEEYLETLKYAYLYGKSVTLLPTHDQRTNAVMLRNRRIGVGMSGIVQAISKFGRERFLFFANEGYRAIQGLDNKYSEWLCINRSVKTTTVKPSGTVSLLAGATPGIHYDHSEYYIRNVRLSTESKLVDPCIDAGYLIEPCKYQPSTLVVSFPVKSQNFEKSKNDVTVIDQLSLIRDLQTYWSDNSVSSTVTFTKDEVSSLSEALRMYEEYLKSVSFLPISDHGYEQAPYIEITKDKYEELIASVSPLDVRDGHEIVERFCDGDRCEIPIKGN
jgi:adenosylcobalamin-dependent ribonucleoside-triphosphate reductase